VYEVHPEVTFCAWAGEELPPKKTREGAEARRALVKAHFGEIPPLARGMHENDLLDALAALWTAERIAQGNARELGDAHLDVTGLPMRIAY
jgi:predicted RNase H-like nuclease